MRLKISSFLVLAALLPASAQPSSLQTRTFKISAHLISSLTVQGDKDPFDESAKPKKRFHIIDVLKNQGIVFPDGAEAAFDAEKHVLTVTNSPENLALVVLLVQSLLENAPKVIDVRLELFDIAQLEAISLLENAGSTSDASKLVADLRQRAAADDGVKLAAAPSLTTRSGQRAKASSGKIYRYVSGYSFEGGKETPQTDQTLNGTTLETDLVIGADGSTIDVNLHFEHALADLEIRPQSVVGPHSGQKLDFESAIENKAVISAATTLLDGQSKFIGALEGAGAGRSLVAFLTAKIKPVIR